MKPEELKYTKDHAWVAVEKDVAQMGITDFAQKELGDVVFIDLPEIGRKCVAGQAIGSIESVKTQNDLLAPLTGEVVEVNPLLKEKPDTVNGDPYGKGWMMKIKMSAPAELSKLMNLDAYEKHTKGQ
ncbi:MAG: glycine cleavage system protein GcvH [Spirochaetia bacterium]|jgi:glycine cleavage system H protein